MHESFSFERSALSSVSPSSSAFIQQQHLNFQQKLNEMTQISTPSFVSNFNEINAANSDANSVSTAFNGLGMMERLAAILFIQQEQQRLQQQNLQQQHILDGFNAHSSIYAPQLQRACSSTPSSIEMHTNEIENVINENLDAKTTNNNNLKTINNNNDFKSINICSKSLINGSIVKDENLSKFGLIFYINLVYYFFT